MVMKVHFLLSKKLNVFNVKKDFISILIKHVLKVKSKIVVFINLKINVLNVLKVII